jgi:DNA-binding transcriptional ArsR family regulator
MHHQLPDFDMPDSEQVDLAAETFRLLADPTRIKILWALLQGESSVACLADIAGTSPTAVSQHLAKLRMSRLVTAHRQGTFIYYSAADDHVFLTDSRYGWVPACEQRFGTFPSAVCHEWNTIAHVNQYEGRPEARAFTRAELQRFFDYADDQVERAVRNRRKGALVAYRDATAFKVIYGWGLRRTET